MTRARALLAALLACAALTTSAAAWVAPRALAREAPVEVGHVRVEAGPHFLASAAQGRLDGVLVIELVGPASVARLARSLALDVSIEGVAVGRVEAERVTPLLRAPATFRTVLHAELAPQSAEASALALALDRHLGAAALEASGTVALPFGVERPVRVTRLASVLLGSDGPEGPTGPFAFSGPLK